MILKKDEKITTNFETVNEKDALHRSYLDKKVLKIDGHISLLEKKHNEVEILSDKQPIEEVLIERAAKTTIQKLYDKGLFVGFPNADENLEDFLFVTRRRCDLEESNRCHSLILLKNIN